MKNGSDNQGRSSFCGKVPQSAKFKRLTYPEEQNVNCREQENYQIRGISKTEFDPDLFPEPCLGLKLDKKLPCETFFGKLVFQPFTIIDYTKENPLV